MFLLKTAWENILFHRSRTLLSVLLIAVATAAILLYEGFVEYSKRGMAIGFVHASGHIQIAKKGFWDEKYREREYLLEENDISFLSEYASNTQHVKRCDAVLNFQGIIAKDDIATIFWGSAYDDPSSLGVSAGEPVFSDEQHIVVGEGLFKKLNLNLEEDATVVTLMTTLSGQELNTGSFEVSGIINTASHQNDAGLLIASRHALLKYFEAEDQASYIRIYLENEDDVLKVKRTLDEYFLAEDLPYETRDWKALNPQWEQVSNLFSVQVNVMSGILFILILLSLSPSISASFMERMGEFGTMEAIGLKKSALCFSLILEVLIIAFLAVFIGLLIAKSSNFFTEFFDITMNPPGSNMNYRLRFVITQSSIVKSTISIVIVNLFALSYPLYTITRLTAHHLMHYNKV